MLDSSGRNMVMSIKHLAEETNSITGLVVSLCLDVFTKC
jgi:hypothetical protein